MIFQFNLNYVKAGSAAIEVQAKSEAVVASKAAIAIQRQVRKFQAENSKVNGTDNVRSYHAGHTLSSNARNKSSKAKYSMHEILTLKNIFNEIDGDGSGKISVKELAGSFKNMDMRNVISVFDSIDSDNSGSITFEELLRTLYPLATTAEYKIMMAWAYPLEIKSDELDTLIKLFQKADVDCIGAVIFHGI